MMCSAVSPDTEANVSVCVCFRYSQADALKYVGIERELEIAWLGLLPPVDQRHKGLYTQTQTHVHFRKSRRLVKMLESFRKTGNIWSRILMLFFLLSFSFFFATWVFFKMCLFFFCRQKKKIFLFCRGGSLGFVDLPQLKVQITDTLTLWSVYFFPVGWEETNPPLVCFFDSSFRDQNPPPATLWTLCCVLCATCGSGVMLCVFLQCELNQPHTPASATSLSVCKTRGRSRSSVTRLDSICYEFQCLERRRRGWADRHFSLSATRNAEYFPDSLMWVFSVFLGLYIVINLIFLSFGWTWID